MSDEQPNPETAERIIAQRIVLEQLIATVFASLGQTKQQLDGFAQHVRSVVGVKDPTHPNAAQAEKAVATVVKHVDEILAEARRNMPE